MPLAPLKNRAKKHESKKARAARRLRNTLIAVIVLAMIAGGIAVVLLWLMKPQKPSVVDGESKPVINPMQIARPKVGPDVSIGSTIQMISSPIAPGDNASVTLRTTERAICSIKVYHLGPLAEELDAVKDSGLTEKTADEFGMVTWTWTMPADAKLVTWKADIFCKRDSKTTRSVGEVAVERKKAS